MADDRQRLMPLPEDRVPPRGKELAYPEAVQLVDPVEPEFKGEVYKTFSVGVKMCFLFDKYNHLVLKPQDLCFPSNE